MRTPTQAELTDAIADATRRAVVDLFAAHPDHHFYYCSLITTGEARAPVLSAWSREALQAYGMREGLDADELLNVKKCFDHDLPAIRNELADLPVDIEVEAL